MTRSRYPWSRITRPVSNGNDLLSIVSKKKRTFIKFIVIYYTIILHK